MSHPSFDDSKYFYKSDLMIYGKPYSYVATKMISNRTAGPESGNGEGKKNYHFGEGSTLIFKTGDEYINARVGWNYRAIPGTTVEQKSDTLPLVNWGINASSKNKFAGGISDGSYGLCAFQLHRAYYYSTITANKSYFFFDGGFVALGSEIKSSSNSDCDVWTTIDQPERKSDVKFFINGTLEKISLSSSAKLSFTNITDGAWFYCNGKGYIVLPDKNGVNLKFWAENRTGDWHDLDVTYSSGDIHAVNIFQLSINHLKKPKNEKYAYIVFPNITEQKLNDYFKNLPVKILENSKNIQAVQQINSNIIEIVFYKKGSIAINSPLNFIPIITSGKGGKGDLIISVDKPAIVLLRNFDNQLNVSIADPNQNQQKIIMSVNAKLEGGKNIVYNPETGYSKITFILPQDIYLGKSVNQSFVIIPKSTSWFSFLSFLSNIFNY